MAPKWSQFLQKFLISKTPAVQDESVCANNATAVGQEDSVRLFLNPTISKIGLRNYLVSSNLAVRTDLAQVDYGLFSSFQIQLAIVVKQQWTNLLEKGKTESFVTSIIKVLTRLRF